MDKKLLNVCVYSIIGCMLISYPLWLNSRTFPVSPVIDWLVFPDLPQFLLLLIFGILSALLLIQKESKSKFALISFVSILILLALQDQIRWQPWFYLFGLLIFVVWIYRSKLINKVELEDIFRIALIGVYIWSGVHKFNAAFVEGTLPNTFNLNLGVLGYTVSIIETFLGIGLIFKRSRKISVIGLFGMHLFIFYQIFSGNILYDLVIVPWNIGMIILLFLLFWNSEISFLQFNRWKPSIISATILFLFVPSLNFYGLWQSYPSFNLFSGKVSKAYLYVDEELKELFSKKTQEKFDVENKISIQQLTYSELHVPSPPEINVYLNIFKNLCQNVDNDLQVILEVKELPDITENKWISRSYFCSDFDII